MSAAPAQFVTLFHEGAALTNAEQWLIELHNTAREGDAANGRTLGRIREVFLGHFFPVPVELQVSASEARLLLPGQSSMRLDQLSDGYRSMLALGIDLLRCLIRSFPDSSDPTNNSGVVLIDELDAHLHPTWQREIGHWLRARFPKLQFIIATHSPFLAQVAEPCGNIVLSGRGGRVEKDQDPESVHTWRTDQILTEPFQLPNTYSPDVDKDLRRYQDLFLKGQLGGLTASEETEYEELRRWHQTLPLAVEEPQQRRLLETLQQAVEHV